MKKVLDDEEGDGDTDKFIDIDDVTLDDVDNATAVELRPVSFDPELPGMWALHSVRGRIQHDPSFFPDPEHSTWMGTCDGAVIWAGQESWSIGV